MFRQIFGLVKPPDSLCAANRQVIEVQESGVGEVDCVPDTSHALVDDLCGGGLAGTDGLDSHHLTAVWVSIRLRAHQAVGESNDLLGAAIVGPSACSESSFVVGDLSGAGRAARAFTS